MLAIAAPDSNLDYNKLRPEGAAHVSEMLKVNSTLQSISLYNNELGDEGAEHISQALQVNRTLKELILQSNRIGKTARAQVKAAHASHLKVDL